MGLVDSVFPQLKLAEWCAAGAIVLILCTWGGVQTWRLHSAQTQLAEQGRALDAALHARDDALATNKGLADNITAQNKAYADLVATSGLKEKTAQRAGEDMLRRPMPVIPGHGPDTMNAFVQHVFGAP